MLPVGDVAKQIKGLGFERVKTLPGSTYKDTSTVVIVPTRGSINYRVVNAWQGLMFPMNGQRFWLFAAGDEVGKAYNGLIENILKHPVFGKCKYLLTLEDDNLPPIDALIRLRESIEHGPKFDAVSGLYFTKGDFNMPMAYGDPEKYKRTGVLDFEPVDIRRPLENGELLEVNGIGMGCALWRMDLFRRLPAPWFVTVSDVFPDEGGAVAFSQDLYFCKRAREAGVRFAVDMRVHVGHLDVTTGLVY